jgi:hypothetical protein
MTRRGTRSRAPGVSRWIASGLSLLFAAVAVPVSVVNGYLALLTGVAYARRRNRPRVADSLSSTHRLAVLIPAHDEEGIIDSTVDSVVGQLYPPDLFSVHVVADNCTDRTADVARGCGAYAHERFDPAAPGKGPALGWLVERVLAERSPPDGLVIIDADTTMSPGFLRVVDTALAGDGSVWQAYYTVREPELSSSTALRYAALALRHYVRPLGRAALGASCGLFGNGMVFRADVLRARQFSAHLTEDLELQLDLLLDGERIGFLPDAVVEAEMPATLAAARTQNERWELGRLQLAKRFVPRLVKRAVRPGGTDRVACLDAALDQLVPPLSVLAAGTAALALTAGVVPKRARSRAGAAGVVLAWGSTAALAFHVIGGLRLARAPRAVYIALAQAPRLVAWKVGLWCRMLLRPRDVSWTRTARNEPTGAGTSTASAAVSPAGPASPSV